MQKYTYLNCKMAKNYMYCWTRKGWAEDKKTARRILWDRDLPDKTPDLYMKMITYTKITFTDEKNLNLDTVRLEMNPQMNKKNL